MIVKGKPSGRRNQEFIFDDSPAVSVRGATSGLISVIQYVELRVCQMSAQVISNLIKNAYSCKNIIQRGKKRKFFKALLKASTASSAKTSALALDLKVNLQKVRLLCFDSDPLTEQ